MIKHKDEPKESGNTIETNFATRELIWYCGRKQGHASPDCKLKDKMPLEESYVQKSYCNRAKPPMMMHPVGKSFWGSDI